MLCLKYRSIFSITRRALYLSVNVYTITGKSFLMTVVVFTFNSVV